MESYLVLKRNDILTYVATQLNLEDITLSKTI